MSRHADGKPRGYTDLTPLAAHQPLRQHAYNSVRSVAEEVGASDDMLKGKDDGPIHAGWSDDEIDFDDGGDNGGQGEECCFTEAELEIAKEGTTSPPAQGNARRTTRSILQRKIC